MSEKVLSCGVGINTQGNIDVKIGEDVYSFLPEDARTLANQIKRMVRQATGLTNRRKKRV